MAFYGLRDLFHKIPLPPHVKPAIGGLGVGLLALALPQVLGGGYGWIQQAIDGQLAVGHLFTLIFAKLLAFALTVSSGGSGGVFAPSLYVGAMTGGFLAQIVGQPPAAFVVVGMAAVFSGAARVPIATLLMVTEMTDGFHLLVPAALAVTLSYLVQARLSRGLKYWSLYEMQVPGRPDSPAHYLEHLEAALRLLRQDQVRLPRTFSHLDLLSLLNSGVPLDLPDGKQLAVGIINPQTSWVGRRLGDAFPQNGHSNGVEIAAVLRQNHTMLPEPDIELQAGDRLLAVTSPEAWERLDVNFANLVPQEDGQGSEIQHPGSRIRLE
jgi:CIC family chloride channel protein